jgi:hypothetical protein
VVRCARTTRELTSAQRGTLARIAVTNNLLYKGYLIKEQIREAFKSRAATVRS